MIDPIIAAQFHRNTASQARRIKAHQAHIAHSVQPNETLDPSLCNTRVYGNRANWYLSAAVNGFCDVDLAIETGLYRYPQTPQRNRTKGMRLYEKK